MAGSEPLPFDPAAIDEIAARFTDAVVARVVELIKADGVIVEVTGARAWLTAQEVAQLLGVSREWVYAHADELGAMRIGSGPRPRLRFPAQSVDGRDSSDDAARLPTLTKPKGG